MNWTDENVTLLRQYVAQVDPPLSAADIARHLDCSRNAVIGKVHRLGLKLHASASQRRTFNPLPRRPRARPVRVAPKTPTKPIRGTITRVTHYHGPANLAPLPLPLPRSEDKARVLFADLEPHHCRYVPGEPKDGFCGLEKVPGTSYCAGHLQRCYTGPDYVPRSMVVHEKIGGTQTTEANVSEMLEPA